MSNRNLLFPGASIKYSVMYVNHIIIHILLWVTQYGTDLGSCARFGFTVKIYPWSILPKGFQDFYHRQLPALIPPLLRKGDTPAEARACLWGQECPQLERWDKSGYAAILTGSKLQWGLQSPSEAMTQLNLCRLVSNLQK